MTRWEQVKAQIAALAPLSPKARESSLDSIVAVAREIGASASESSEDRASANRLLAAFGDASLTGSERQAIERSFGRPVARGVEMRGNSLVLDGDVEWAGRKLRAPESQ